MLLTALKILAVISGALSAAFWLKAGVTKVKPTERDGWSSGGLITTEKGQNWDVGETLWRQAKWSGRGAWAAAVAALCGVLALLVEMTGASG